MKKLNKKGTVALELLALIVVPGALTAFIVYKIGKKLGLTKKLKSFNLQLQK